MKKIININFHSRVIPIEETAYEILQLYVESLRRYFAYEEGRDEIISDIENRFAELFSEILKKGAACITDADVNNIITSMGRPEEFEGTEARSTDTSQTAGATGSGSSQQSANTQQQGSWQQTADEPRRLYRAENDKILGGVCSGLAHYLRLDPAIVRIIFVLITLGYGAGFLLYIILWMVLPNRALPTTTRKRLYRNPDDRVIGGVASGLAAYFHIEVWIPRLIFALPLILGVITSILRASWFYFGGPVFFTGGFGGTLFITYIVLWIVLPEAISASEKLEMRGEKVDLESIKNTIRNDLEGFKGRVKETGTEIQQKVQQVGQQFKQTTQNFAYEAGPVIRKSGTGIGHAIGVLFKAFFLFIAGLIAFALIMVLAGLAFRGDGVLHIKSFILEGFWENFLAWAGFILFLVIPVVALLTWLIRRITGTRSRSHYLGYSFATLWILGLFCIIALAGMVLHNFRSRQHIEDNVSISQPPAGKMVVRVLEASNRYRDTDWWSDMDWGSHGPFYSINDDSLLLATVRVRLLKSDDSAYHVRTIRFSRGSSTGSARDLAGQIQFPITQTDSTLTLPQGFTISRGQKFRNQQVLVEIAIPVGKKIIVNRSVEDYHWFTINPNNNHIRWSDRRDDWTSDWNEDIDESESYPYTSNVEYVMTSSGLSRTDRKNIDHGQRRRIQDDPDNDPEENKGNEEKREKNNDGYRYKSPEQPKPKNNTDTSAKKSASLPENSATTQTFLLAAMLNL